MGPATEQDKNDSKEEQNKGKKPLLLPITTKIPPIKRLFRHKWARVGAAAVVAVPLVAALAWWGWSNSSLSKLGVDAALVEGTVEYRLDYDDPWEKVQEGMSFGEGAQLRTLADSRAVLNIDDGSAVRLNSNSSVILTQLTAKHIIVENTGGDVYARVVKSDKRAFQVRSGSATYESLGTAYRTFNTDKKEGVEVYHSKVNILGLKADGKVLVDQGKRYYMVNTASTDLEGKVSELSLEELSADEFIKWNSEQDKKDFEKELGVLSDLSPPKLEVASPANGLVTDAASIEVKGTTEAGAKVLVNGNEVTNNSGQFSTTINLNEGANAIKVEAVDKSGNKTTKELSVTRSTAPPTSSSSFKLYGAKASNGVSFTWSISGISVTKGFKLLLSKSGTPIYGAKGTDSVYIKSSSARSYTWELTSGKTYNFRICVYNGSGCSSYSNTITVASPYIAPTPPTGSLTLSPAGGSNVSWSISGGTAYYGYKLVWSTSTGPTYPGSSANFYDKTATSGSITSEPGTYYVRVCMYYEGTCKNYSNEITVTIP